MFDNLPPILAERLELIQAWLLNNKMDLVTKKVRITLNISVDSVKGEITKFPDSN